MEKEGRKIKGKDSLMKVFIMFCFIPRSQCHFCELVPNGQVCHGRIGISSHLVAPIYRTYGGSGFQASATTWRRNFNEGKWYYLFNYLHIFIWKQIGILMNKSSLKDCGRFTILVFHYTCFSLSLIFGVVVGINR